MLIRRSTSVSPSPPPARVVHSRRTRCWISAGHSDSDADMLLRCNVGSNRRGWRCSRRGCGGGCVGSVRVVVEQKCWQHTLSSTAAHRQDGWSNAAAESEAAWPRWRDSHAGQGRAIHQRGRPAAAVCCCGLPLPACLYFESIQRSLGPLTAHEWPRLIPTPHSSYAAPSTTLS